MPTTIKADDLARIALRIGLFALPLLWISVLLLHWFMGRNPVVASFREGAIDIALIFFLGISFSAPAIGTALADKVRSSTDTNSSGQQSLVTDLGRRAHSLAMRASVLFVLYGCFLFALIATRDRVAPGEPGLGTMSFFLLGRLPVNLATLDQAPLWPLAALVQLVIGAGCFYSGCLLRAVMRARAHCAGARTFPGEAMLTTALLTSLCISFTLRLLFCAPFFVERGVLTGMFAMAGIEALLFVYRISHARLVLARMADPATGCFGSPPPPTGGNAS